MEKRYEVLAPAGNLKAVLPMIEAGADAIYVGLKGFSSRPSVIDFTIDDVREALKICHDRDKKLYVAVNVSISEQDIDAVINQIYELDEMGVDSVILAELGLAMYFGSRLKHAAVHASTLLGVYNIATVKLLQESGVKRIIFYANLYADEMSAIINAVPDMEYELVAEGGTCFNDIRQCLMPHSYVNMEHKLYCRERNYLCGNGEKTPAKPICEYANEVAEVLGVYMGMGITSFKIEGRTAPMEERIPNVKRCRKYLDEFIEHGHPGAFMHYFDRARREMW